MAMWENAGKSSERCNVWSGVPQGTVLGPLCFLVFINDIGKNLSPDTTLNLFADDNLAFRVIEDKSDTETLQKDLDTLATWANLAPRNYAK